MPGMHGHGYCRDILIKEEVAFPVTEHMRTPCTKAGSEMEMLPEEPLSAHSLMFALNGLSSMS